MSQRDEAVEAIARNQHDIDGCRLVDDVHGPCAYACSEMTSLRRAVQAGREMGRIEVMEQHRQRADLWKDAVAREEREACAKAVEDTDVIEHSDSYYAQLGDARETLKAAAAAIRARSKVSP